MQSRYVTQNVTCGGATFHPKAVIDKNLFLRHLILLLHECMLSCLVQNWFDRKMVHPRKLER